MEAHVELQLMDELEAGEIAVDLDEKEPQEVLAWAIERFGASLSICSSLQAESCALIDMAWRIDPAVRVFTIDTGRQPQETYELIDRIREQYGIRIEVFMPETAVIEKMVTRHGNNLFYRDVGLRLLCCQVRKVLPLRRALMTCSAWVTGLRRDQWATRSNILKVEIDHDHGGIVKLAPLADWTEVEVWGYLRAKAFRTTRYTIRVTNRSDARRARGPWPRVMNRVRGDGGGRPARRRSAGCIAR